MQYYIVDGNNQSSGPYTKEQLAGMRVSPKTMMWREGMANWEPAHQFPELASILAPPDVPQNTPPPNYGTRSGAPFDIYEANFDIKRLHPDDLQKYKAHKLDNQFPGAVGVILHILTFGLFNLIHCGMLHDKLPKIKTDDPNAGKAIGFMFIPFFNIYWRFMFWMRLTKRVNLQFKLRGEAGPVSEGLAMTTCIMALIPYINLISFIVLTPILYGQIQYGVNQLAKGFTEQSATYYSS